MRWTDIHVRASALALGHKEDVASAVAAGRYDQDLHLAHGYRSVSVAGDVLPVDMAVAAATTALARSGLAPEDFLLSMHVYSTRQGPDDLTPASYVQGRTVRGTGPALEVRQTCNGAIAALELSAAYLTAARTGAALVTTADQHGPPADRYALGSVDADGASAVVLSGGTGPIRLLSTAVMSDGRFSATEPADPRDFPDRGSFLAEQRRRLLPMLESMAALERDSVAQALADAEVDSADIARWVFPNIGANMVDQEFRKAFGIDELSTTWDWGRTVGHLGTGDQFGGLTHLVETGAVGVGDRVALCGNGLGFSYGCAVLEVVTEPEWA